VQTDDLHFVGNDTKIDFGERRTPMSTLAIDFGGTEIKLGTLEGGTLVATAALTPSGTDADLAHVRDTAALLGGDIDAVGIALPGVIDHTVGAMIAAHGKYQWALGRELRTWATDVFAVPAVVENDARAALYGEVRFGAAAGARDAVLMTLGTGIGTAAMMDGRLVRGAHGHAGILGGHLTVELDGPECNCGNRGCAEAVASTWALARDIAADPRLAAGLGLGEGVDADARPGLKLLFEHADDTIVAPVLERYLRAWGAGVVGLCHSYDPDVVIVSGGVLRSADKLMPALTDYVRSHLWSSSHRPEFVVPKAPEHSVLLGLSALASELRKEPA
jgi:glucokinase